jgi:segregation and condensation protein A
MPNTPPKETLAAPAPAPSSAWIPVPGGKGDKEEPFPYFLKIGEVFDGPFDVLLALIRKQNLDIYDLPIAQITKQFQGYVKHLRREEVDTAGEFVQMASQLIFIKSCLLLPSERAADDRNGSGDPRKSLVEQLLQYEQVKQAAQMLMQMQKLEASTWTNPGAREFRDNQEDRPNSSPPEPANTTDLASLFQQVIERTTNRPALRVESDTVTVANMVDYLRQRLEIEDTPISLVEAIGGSNSPSIVSAAVLALLEMVRVGAVLLRQDSQFGNIQIKKTADFEQVMNTKVSSDQWT